MKNLLFTFGLFCAMTISSMPAVAADADPKMDNFSTDGAWTSDYAAALVRAAAGQKTVLLNFTGSDWCVWCHRLRDEVFSQKPFLDFARDHLVLVEIDFPRRTPQSEKLREQNEAFAKRFNVTGYPTILLVDAAGHELGRTGYMQGGPKTFLRELKRFAAKSAAATAGSTAKKGLPTDVAPEPAR